MKILRRVYLREQLTRIAKLEQMEKDFIKKHNITNPYNGPAESRYYD